MESLGFAHGFLDVAWKEVSSLPSHNEEKILIHLKEANIYGQLCPATIGRRCASQYVWGLRKRVPRHFSELLPSRIAVYNLRKRSAGGTSHGTILAHCFVFVSHKSIRFRHDHGFSIRYLSGECSQLGAVI